MFQAGHIISASKLIRNFSKVVSYIFDNPEPILITNKNGRLLVLITTEMFEDLTESKLKNAGLQPPLAYLRSMLEHN